MSSYTGKNIGLTIFGESHGEAVGCVITGLCPGLPLSAEEISEQLERRKPNDSTGTKRRETDMPKIISGLYKGHTTGTPLTIIIENTDVSSSDYENTSYLLRPSHADYTGYVKYGGFADPRGGGHFSGRLTAPIVAAGAVFKKILKTKGIDIGTHILTMSGIDDVSFLGNEDRVSEWIDLIGKSEFPVIESDKKIGMISAIEKAARDKDSIGGVLETAVAGVAPGIGEPIFDSIESVLSSLLFSVPGIKGVQFGLGFGFAQGKGSVLNDQFDIKDNEIITGTNNNGGINGGVSNGMPIVFSCVVKPTPSIYLKQNTVNIKTMKREKIQISGRHDPAIIHRAAVVVDSVAAFGILDLLCSRYGYMWMREQES